MDPWTFVCQIILSILFLTGIVFGAEPAEQADTPLLEQLQLLSEKLKGVKDMTAEFKQEKFTALLKKPLVSTGRVWVKGERTLWHTAKPHETWTQTDAVELRIYDPKAKTLEVYDLDRRMADLAASPVPRLDILTKSFHIERAERENDDKNENVLVVRLTPIKESLAKYVRSVLVRIDTRSGLATRVEWADADDERTVISFDKVKVNTGLKDEQVTITTPKGVKVVRPLGEGE